MQNDADDTAEDVITRKTEEDRLQSPQLRLSHLKQALRSAKVRGRSRARTHEQALALCAKHGLLESLAAASRNRGQEQEKRQELPFDMLCEICTNLVAVTVNFLSQEAVKVREARVFQETDQAASVKNSRLNSRSTAQSVARKVMKYADDTTKSLLALRLTSKLFASMLHPKSEHWNTLLRVFNECSETDMHARDAPSAVRSVEEGRLTPLRACVLVTTTGCEACGAKRIRKVQWPFGARLCEKCLFEHTTSDFRIWERYRLSKHNLVHKVLPSVSRDLYSPRVGSYRLTFYLNRHVLQLLRETHGLPFVSLREAHDYVHRDRIAYERDLSTRNDEFFKAIEERLTDRILPMYGNESTALLEKITTGRVPLMRTISRTFHEACKNFPAIRPQFNHKTVNKVVEQCWGALSRFDD